jgi:protein gp37
MRTQECREHIDAAAEMCGLDAETVRQVQQAADFVDALPDDVKPEISGLSTHALKPLIRESNAAVIAKVASSISNMSKAETNRSAGGKFKKKPKRITERMVRDVLREVKKELVPLEDIATIKKSATAKFNETNENIEWAPFSWNPLTGCKHGCDYCYARDIAERFPDTFPLGFEPNFLPERLTAPKNTKVPESNAPGSRGVFVCSMADLFGEWVPREQIDAVLTAVAESPQWTYIFLTKNPKRLGEFVWPFNAWVGATVDTQARVAPTEKAFENLNAPVKFVSCEPLLERVSFSHISIFDWLIIGGRSQTSTGPEFQPDWEWVEHLMSQARGGKIRVYWKPNLTVRPKEFPDGGCNG